MLHNMLTLSLASDTDSPAIYILEFIFHDVMEHNKPVR